ncbi:NmrA family NAD(P)-binding protein [Cryobacterium sp. SO1]|uniref:NmrA family NAD(P)-binding protein n=1 Tax=Cryobacterium sp. SO1 TaxID=1897061 RepID=UPI001022E394|nr:NmrA family NAD(P)-binding protein [Cryobacterium sp. SO1]RZI36301.1 NAD(P)H azoreductase [Cryobacterium sp. SO1]
MNDQTSSPRRTALTGKILVTGASGTVGQAVVDALAAAGETVIAGMRDPRAWIAEGARRASGTAGGQQPGGYGTGRPGGGSNGSGRGAGVPGTGGRGVGVPGTGRSGTGGPGTGRPGAGGTGHGAAAPLGKPLRAPNQKPELNPAHKPEPSSLPATAAPQRTVGRPGAGAATGAGRGGKASAQTAAHPIGHAVDGSGASVRAFDFGDRSTWARALAGVDRVFLLVPPTIAEVGRTLIPFIDQAMEESGVQQIVFLSAPGVRSTPRSPHHLVEQYLKRTRTPHTILRPNVLMQTLSTLYRDDIRLRGEIVLPAGRAPVAFVDADDVGRVAARVLTEPGHLGKSYSLAGEQALSYAQVAEILTDVLNRPVRYTATTEAEFAESAAKQGATAPDIAAQASWYRVARLRLTALPNRSIRRLTGEGATTLRQFVEDHRQSWL